MTPPVNVALHLRRRAAETPHTPALHIPTESVRPTGNTPHRTVTYAELDADADALAHGLSLAGVTHGSRVAVMVPPSADFFALTFALLRRRAVPVLIDPGMGVKNLGICLAEADPGAFIGVPKAHLARRLFGWLHGKPLVTVNVGGWRFFCQHTLAGLRGAGTGRGQWDNAEPPPDETAAILFTSGSTGPAKGAVYTHGVFAAQVESLKATYGIEPGEVDLCTFPLFALFSPALGMACVVPDMDPSWPARIDPAKAVAQVRQFGATNLFGSPAVVRRLGDYGQSLPTLKRAISAGAPASAPAVERFAKLLPAGAELFTPYGATEALPVANIGSREILAETQALTEQGKGVCVGRPVPGVTVQVIRISDDPIPEWSDSLLSPPGEVGEFVVRGPVVTRSYFNRPAATELAKIVDWQTGEVLHRMGDVGYVDEQGRLWFCGRKSHRVVTPHGTLFTDMVEPVFNTAGLVKRTALVGVRRATTVHPVVCVEVEPAWGAGSAWKTFTRVVTFQPGLMLGPNAVWDIARYELRSLAAPLYRRLRVKTFLWHRGSFPVDVRHNSKIFREKLAVWADKTLGPKWDGGPA